MSEQDFPPAPHEGYAWVLVGAASNTSWLLKSPAGESLALLWASILKPGTYAVTRSNNRVWFGRKGALLRVLDEAAPGNGIVAELPGNIVMVSDAENYEAAQ